VCDEGRELESNGYANLRATLLRACKCRKIK